LTNKTDEGEASKSKSEENSNNVAAIQQQETISTTNDTSSSASKTNSSAKVEEEPGKHEENNVTVKVEIPDSTTAKPKPTEEATSSALKNDLASGILITEKDGSDEESQHLMKEKEPADLVKELIGIPSKHLILKEKEDGTKSLTKDSKAEKQDEDSKLSKTGKTTDDSSEKFNIEEVSKTNKEHHDIPDSDMKDGAHLNSSDVASFENKITSSDEDSSPEKTTSTSGFETLDSSSAEKTSPTSEKTLSTMTEERAHFGMEQRPSKQTLMADTKSIKHSTGETESIAKMVKDNAAKKSSKHISSAKKKISGAGDEDIEFVSPHEKAALANPLITKEANEFSNEQEKSFASAIEKIKAQEEKLKGKEIDNEIHETLSPLSKKHSKGGEKKSGNNAKQFKVYRHQILSEVKKIDDLISEYHKDGHSTKELSEAKVVLQQDLNLVKELEKGTKKKTIKKEKGKETTMPSSAYLSSISEEKKVEMPHHSKAALEAKSTTKSRERETERSEKQLEEYYFHTDPKSSVKHAKKPSLGEIHKLLKAEIKSLKEKKNGKADSQLKNIRKLVQQHLKKLISTGDIDKTAFHSLAPEIKQLGNLLKERIKSLKKKKVTHIAKTKSSLKPSSLTQKLKTGNPKKAGDMFDQSMQAQVSTNEIKGGKVKSGKAHKFTVEPKIGILEPSLENVAGVDAVGGLCFALDGAVMLGRSG
jgi:hypothetical protein